MQVHRPHWPRSNPIKAGVREEPGRLAVHLLDPPRREEPEDAGEHDDAEDDAKRGDGRDVDGPGRCGSESPCETVARIEHADVIAATAAVRGVHRFAAPHV